jgi:hypothetical protein
VSGAGPRLRAALANTALVVGSCLLTAVLVEGSASAYLFVRDTIRRSPARLMVRPHTMPDTLLGWVNRAGFTSADEYGKGIGFSTDARGLRASRTMPAPVSGATVRIVCSGDEFTMGYGVDDVHPWCARLEAELPGVETMNLGQAAYGLDQAVLRYERDGVPYGPQLQIVAVTDALLERVLASNYAGVPKPRLAVDGKQLQVRGVPVPPPTDASIRRAARLRLVDDLRLVQLVRRMRGASAAADVARAVDAQWPLIDAIVTSLADGQRARGSELMLVYLPGFAELRPGTLDGHRRSLARTAAAHGLVLVDLTAPFRAMRPDSQDLAFIADPPSGAAPGLRGQYSNIGNAWVARELAMRVREMPRAGAQVRGAGPGRRRLSPP